MEVPQCLIRFSVRINRTVAQGFEFLFNVDDFLIVFHSKSMSFIERWLQASEDKLQGW